MSFINTLEDIATGAIAGVVVVTALPIFGVAGTVTAAGSAFGSVVGGVFGFLDSMDD